jgi:hypothetical protein
MDSRYTVLQVTSSDQRENETKMVWDHAPSWYNTIILLHCDHELQVCVVNQLILCSLYLFHMLNINTVSSCYYWEQGRLRLCRLQAKRWTQHHGVLTHYGIWNMVGSESFVWWTPANRKKVRYSTCVSHSLAFDSNPFHVHNFKSSIPCYFISLLYEYVFILVFPFAKWIEMVANW